MINFRLLKQLAGTSGGMKKSPFLARQFSRAVKGRKFKLRNDSPALGYKGTLRGSLTAMLQSEASNGGGKMAMTQGGLEPDIVNQGGGLVHNPIDSVSAPVTPAPYPSKLDVKKINVR